MNEMPEWKKQLRDQINAGYFRKMQNEVIGPIAEVFLDEAFYDLPPGFKKPTQGYPGLGGFDHKKAMSLGYVDAGLIDPDHIPNEKTTRSTILRSVIKLLIASKGDNAFIRDPEAVLPILFGHVKSTLKLDLDEALEAMYDKPIPVTVAGVKTKKGVPGWRFKAEGLSKLVPDA